MRLDLHRPTADTSPTQITGMVALVLGASYLLIDNVVTLAVHPDPAAWYHAWRPLVLTLALITTAGLSWLLRSRLNDGVARQFLAGMSVLLVAAFMASAAFVAESSVAVAGWRLAGELAVTGGAALVLSIRRPAPARATD
jgi:hypothetical protein